MHECQQSEVLFRGEETKLFNHVMGRVLAIVPRLSDR